MPTIAYQNKDGKRLQGITTLKSQQIGWGKQPLMIWANKQGLEGRTLNEARDTATITGTICHLLIEMWLKGDHDGLKRILGPRYNESIHSFYKFS